MPRLHSPVLLMLVLLVGFVAPVTTASAATALSGEEIKSEIVDRAFAYKGVENGQRKKGRIFYESTGRVRILTLQGVRDGGSWKVDRNGNFCTRITLGRGNQLKCFSIFEWQNGKYKTDHGYALYPVEDSSLIGIDRPGPN